MESENKNYVQFRDCVIFISSFLFKSIECINTSNFNKGPLSLSMECGIKGTMYDIGAVFISQLLPGDTK